MYKISLINMPFANVGFPSIALTQLKAVLEERLGDRVSVRVFYMNQEIAQYLGLKLYNFISDSLETNMSGMGDWLFRQIAFPGLEDNAEEYFQRCFPGMSEETRNKNQQVLRKRKGLATLLDRLISQHGIAEDDLVGFTSMFCQNVASFAMARRIKDKNPRIDIALGGANCEAPMGPELVRRIEQIDYVFSGPGLITFPDFVESKLNGDLKHETIPGVYSKRNTLFPVAGADQLGAELDIDHHVPLDYGPFLDALEKNFSSREIEPVLLFETSRGCWWGQKAHCTFCGLNGGSMAYRAMEPKAAIRQFQELFFYASRCSTFNAVDNILPKSYLAEVLPHIDPPENVALFYEVKADLSGADVETLSRAHVKRIQPGIESLNTFTLKLMKKGTTVFQNLALLKNCLKHAVMPDWNLLTGFPGEPEQVFEKYVADLPRLAHLPPPSGTFHVRFDRYSPYFVRAKEYGLDLRPSDFYRFIYPFEESVLQRIAYYFSDHEYSAKYIGAVAKWSARIEERVADWRSRWHGNGKGAFPKLEWRTAAGRVAVYDSRGGKDAEYVLEPVAIQMLECLATPKRRSDVLGRFNAPEAEEQLAHLERLELVFEEEQRYLSLVMGELERCAGPEFAGDLVSERTSVSPVLV